jgi:hypothetical protein
MRFKAEPVNKRAARPLTYKVIDTRTGKTLFRVTHKTLAERFVETFNRNNSPEIK